jgi:iron(III) transport system ATP-binding protein
MSIAALDVRGVRKAFGERVVLDGVDLEVDDGDIVAVLGPSGGGKTTLLRIIAGFEVPDEGSVAVRGTTVVSSGHSGRTMVPAERRRVGIVPQEGALFPHLDVGRNVAFGLPRGPDAARRVAEVLELVGLPGIERVRPDQLSGGQQQRVALARALAPGPSLVMLDEPFSSLDAALRATVRDEVVSVLRSAGTTAVFVTHDQQEALSVADRVAVLIDGRIAQIGDPTSLYDRPASLAVATFVGEAEVITGRSMGDGTVECAVGLVRSCGAGAATSGTVDVVVRPEQLEIVRSPDHDPAAVTGTVRSRSFYGHDGTVRVELPDGTTLTARVHAARLPRIGDQVSLRPTAPLTTF